MNFKLTLKGEKASGKSTLLAWLLNNIPSEEFSVKQVDDHELSIKHKVLSWPDRPSRKGSEIDL